MPDVVVIGAGVVGLTTAVQLLEHGCKVEVWTRDDPLATTSAVAAAIWYPYLAEPRARVLQWSAVTFRRLAQLAADARTGVVMQRTVELFAVPDPDLWWAPAVHAIERLPAAEVPPGYAAAIAVQVPVCDTTRYLPWLVAAIGERGGTIVRRTVRDFDAAFARAPAVVHCAGLGARELCGDRALRPVRGQVVVAAATPLPHALLDDTGTRPVYVVPRHDDVILGGTAQPGDDRTAPDTDDTSAIVAACIARVPQLAGVALRAVKVGLRPYRSTVRLELERPAPGRQLVHSYGHGGSGFTLSWGCAAEVALLLGVDGARP
ncbi:MAG TPA: FAD-dependent oxidoreductase [Planctomycetota bacterium]|nr:FAD-dependent oxidoreductase [Planctomycetota bacterium]